MTLVMFDIDGTLTETFQVDEECYVQALKDVFGFSGVSMDWSAYKHTSDSGIIDELCQTRLSRAATQAECVAFQSRFIELLSDAALASPHCFRPVAGAADLLQTLAGSADYVVSLATGGWKVSAQFKLKQARLEIEGLPAAFADDALAREKIMETSLQRAAHRHGRSEFASVVYVGDGVWDFKAAKKLGFQFVGIGSGERARRLHGEGVQLIFPDYVEPDTFVATLGRLSTKRA
jgi:phosphoglycolate phosphatase-like HAD superfamily hydrolase